MDAVPLQETGQGDQESSGAHVAGGNVLTDGLDVGAALQLGGMLSQRCVGCRHKAMHTHMHAQRQIREVCLGGCVQATALRHRGYRFSKPFSPPAMPFLLSSPASPRRRSTSALEPEPGWASGPGGDAAGASAVAAAPDGGGTGTGSWCCEKQGGDRSFVLEAIGSDGPRVERWSGAVGCGGAGVVRRGDRGGAGWRAGGAEHRGGCQSLRGELSWGLTCGWLAAAAW